MRVIIAGFNVDKGLIDKLDTELATPEVISAAYARISRSSKSVNLLRKEALGEIQKARKSNSTIIFEMGHSSIAEHAVFNLDIIGVSRLLTDTIQGIRLASFTEKSQRYVTLSSDYIVPTELTEHPDESLLQAYIDLHRELFEEYQTCFKLLKAKYSQELQLHPRELEGKAKEDARYILPLSTATQMGLTINARSLENLLRHLDSSGLAEAKLLHEQIYSQISAVSPSLLRYTKADGFCCQPLEVDPALNDIRANKEAVKLIDYSEDADDRILAGLLYDRSGWAFTELLEYVKSLSPEQKELQYNESFCGIKAWHKVSRAFELAEFTFELQFSESCWAQFKRHRIGSMLKNRHAESSPLIIPAAIVEIGRKAVWEDLALRVETFREELGTACPPAKDYLRLNLSRIRVLCKMNLRELYHFARLRSDIHAQWEIREVSDAMVDQIRLHSPLAAQMLTAKSSLNQKN